jgi:hypothetical protein
MILELPSFGEPEPPRLLPTVNAATAIAAIKANDISSLKIFLKIFITSTSFMHFYMSGEVKSLRPSKNSH